MVTESISEAEYWDRHWWCFLLVLKGGADEFSVTIQGYPDWSDLDYFGEFVIHEPPMLFDWSTL